MRASRAIRNHDSLWGLRLALLLLLSLAAVSCIERSNPFDPLNALSPAPDLRKEYQPGLDAISLSAPGFTAGLAGYRTAFRQDSIANAIRESSNQGRRVENTTRAANNLAVEKQNAAQPSPDSLQEQQELILLDTLLAYGPYGRLKADHDSLQAITLRATRIMEQANARHQPTVVYPTAFQDSVLAPYLRDVGILAVLLADIDAGNRAVAAANDSIRAQNASIAAANESVRSFNRQVAFLKSAKPGEVITRSDSLSKATETAVPGDTILLGSGTFTVDLRFTSGTAEKPIVIRGYPGHLTILRPRGADVPQAGIINQSHIRFEDLVFRGGSNSGIKLSDSSRGVAFQRCLFDSNGTWGVDAAGSDLLLKDSEIRVNGGEGIGGGIRVETFSCADCRIELDNVLVVRNRGVGIEAVSPEGKISHSTISDNESDGLRISATLRNLTVANTILTGNGGFGLYRNPSFENQEGLSMQVYNLWNNAGGNWSLDNLDSSRAQALRDGNLNVDPGFVNPQIYEYGLRPGSILSVYEKSPPFVIIGYRRKP